MLFIVYPGPSLDAPARGRPACRAQCLVLLPAARPWLQSAASCVSLADIHPARSETGHYLKWPPGVPEGAPAPWVGRSARRRVQPAHARPTSRSIGTAAHCWEPIHLLPPAQHTRPAIGGRAVESPDPPPAPIRHAPGACALFQRIHPRRRPGCSLLPQRTPIISINPIYF
jgi:hypothetical protein